MNFVGMNLYLYMYACWNLPSQVYMYLQSLLSHYFQIQEKLYLHLRNEPVYFFFYFTFLKLVENSEVNNYTDIALLVSRQGMWLNTVFGPYLYNVKSECVFLKENILENCIFTSTKITISDKYVLSTTGNWGSGLPPSVHIHEHFLYWWTTKWISVKMGFCILPK